MIDLDYGGSGQGFGGYGFDNPKNPGKYDGKRIGTAYGCEFIRRLLDTLEVEKWEDLPGTHVRADSEMTKVYRIGHILKDKWFDPQELAEEMGVR
ncbi:MAG: hypothetical protein GTN93_10245 [Anaerolineae bacterium]|nr:hypothetical protein [Anaerolineae bacterium]